MTREDAIIKLRRQLPMLSRLGVTGLSLVGGTSIDEVSESDPLKVLLDIDLAKYPHFDLLALVGVDLDLQERLGMPVRAYVADGMQAEARDAITRQAVPIT